MTRKEWTKETLTVFLKQVPSENRCSTACSLIGHSRIISMCFGYVHCGRCEAKIGDRLASIFDTSQSPVLGHRCETCAKNMRAMTWKDLYLVKGAALLNKPVRKDGKAK